MPSTRSKTRSPPPSPTPLYYRLLKDYPTAMNTTQGIIIACLAKITTDHSLHGRFPDVRDYLIQATVQALYIVPLIGAFWAFRTSEKLSAGYKLFLDQCIFSPFFTLGIVLTFKFLYNAESIYANSELMLGGAGGPPTPLGDYSAILSVAAKEAVAAQSAAWLFWIPQVSENFVLVFSPFFVRHNSSFPSAGILSPHSPTRSSASASLQRIFSMKYVPTILALPFNTLCSYFWVCIYNYVTSP